jgi:L-threonylcarbamoyladenylate synthase
VPDHAVARSLLERAGVPVAAPSANRFGRLSPTTAEHVVADLGGEVDVVLDGGPTRWGVESTVVDARGERPVVLRLGSLTVEGLEAAAGPVEVRAGDGDRPATPGALASHYAPGAPLRLLTDGHPPPADREARACLAFRAVPPGYAAGEALSPDGDLVVAAARLFEALHRLDAAARERGLVEIVAEPVPEVGLGRAVLDRLRRAAAPRD